jgi:phosphate transport system substrate-binding protein
MWILYFKNTFNKSRQGLKFGSSNVLSPFLHAVRYATNRNQNHVAYLTACGLLSRNIFATELQSLTGLLKKERKNVFNNSTFYIPHLTGFEPLLRLGFKVTVIFSCVLIFCMSCNKDESIKFIGIEDISFENYPIVDGSTSARALNQMIACKLLGIRYEWNPMPHLGFEWYVMPNREDIPEKHRDFFDKRVITSQTNGAFINLIDGKADIILTHRTISPDEKAHADNKRVTLIETPIALDAFVFVVNKNNPVKSLTVEQIRKIYTGEITNWSEVGGNNANMKVFTRPRNSGSEEVFRQIVMGDLEPAEFPESPIGSMVLVFREVTENADGICYTFDNYKEMIARVPDSEVPKLAINGISPNEATVKNGTFPFISKVHVAIRSDLDRNSMAYKLYEWLQTENVKPALTECGFIPK